MIFGGATAAILVVTVPIGLLSSAGLDRAVSLGFYGLGVLLVILGFLGGSRGPFRSDQRSTRTVGSTRRTPVETARHSTSGTIR